MTTLILLIFGLCLGSFVNALVWRVHQQSAKDKDPKLSVLNGRSMCPHCRHELAARDLVPVFSWLALRGRCRYCHQPIDDSPLIEISLAAVFVASYYFWPVNISGGGQWTLFITWLVVSVGLMALLIYDLRYMLLPSRILYPTLVAAAAGRAAYIIAYQPDKAHGLLDWGLSLAVAAGVFLTLFYVSSGRWIGFGDVRLGFVTGTVLAAPAKSFLMIFLASLLGTLFVMPSVATGRSKMSARIPYGPFLIVGTAISLLFGSAILAWYKNHWL